MLHNSQAMEVEHPTSEVIRYFEGKNVLITGGTGFLGKVLIHKLLSTCTDIGKIYLLIRGKKGKTSAERLSDIIEESPIFEELKQNLKLVNKLKAVDGDITKPELGLTPGQRSELVENVNIIFHSAATVKFDDALENAIQMNVVGTESLINLAKEVRTLSSFVHVSTAYSHCYRDYLDEVFYPTRVDLANTENGTKPWPNSYTMSKAMAENKIAQLARDLPVAIVRPSIVVASRSEPLPGWVDNFNGPNGMIVGFCSGFLKTIYLNENLKCDIIPVDIVINLMISVALERASRSFSEIPIFNCTSGGINPLTWGEMRDKGIEGVLKNPYESSKLIWYPGCVFQSYRILDTILRGIVNWFPAYVTDLYRVIRGKRPYMVKITDRMFKGMKVLEFFTSNEWDWNTSNMEQLFHSLNETDQRLFNFDMKNLNWAKYLEDFALGTRRYLMKQDDSTLEQSRRHLERLRRVEIAFKFGLFFIFLLICDFFISCVWH